MPWTTTDPNHIRRPCCGAQTTTEALWSGRVVLPHRTGCRYARRAA